MSDWATTTGTFDLGDLPLQSGAVLPGAQLRWKTHGSLSPGRDNVVLYPTSYGAQHPDLAWLIGPDGVLDPGRWFIVIPDMFGNGLSSSPSNTPGWPGLVTAWITSTRSAACSPSCGGSSACTPSTAGRWAHSRPITGRPCSPAKWPAR